MVAVLIDAKAQTTTDFLPLRRVAVGVLQVQIWNTFGLSQPSRSAEWEKINRSWLVKGQQPFLVFRIRS